MLIHEWMRYRDKHLPRPEEGEEVAPEAEAVEAPPAEEAPEASGEGAEEAPEEEEEDPEAEMWAEIVALGNKVTADWEANPANPANVARSAPLPSRPAVSPALLDLPEQQNRRLQALMGRQTRLPLEVEEAPAPARRGHPEAAESREELIERLLDPILSINEAAVLCGVCPASIRRYTNRGVLKCFRTPGNQRRFRLSDVLDFMERQQQEPLD
jgi:excisionase family DNA binding protein